jgi:hypothetical protein
MSISSVNNVYICLLFLNSLGAEFFFLNLCKTYENMYHYNVSSYMLQETLMQIDLQIKGKIDSRYIMKSKVLFFAKYLLEF